MQKTDLLDNRKIALIMTGVMLSVFLSALDSTITSTAMPKIVGDMNGLGFYSWPATIYLLCSTISIPILGKISDSFGHKTAFIISVLFFILASVLCGISGNMYQLIIFRGLQGIGGGTLLANSFILVADIFPPVQRAKYTGMLASMIGLSNIIGPLAGGIVADTLGWRWLFFLNVPLGLAALILINVSIPPAKTQSLKKVLDYAGISAFVLTLVPMLLAFSWAGKIYSWFSPQIIGMLAFSLVMSVAFVFIEKNAIEPMIPVSLFKNVITSTSMTGSFLAGFIMVGTIMLTPLMVQSVMGGSATKSGAIIMPMMVCLVVGSIISSQTITRTGRYKFLGIAAFVMMSLGLLLLSQTVIDATDYRIVACMVLFGLGLGAILPVFDLASQNAISHCQIGIITSMIMFARNIGGAVGASILGSVLVSSMSLSVNTKGVQVDSIHNAFLVAVFFSSAGLITALFLKELPLKKTNYELNKSESEGLPCRL